MFQVLFFFLASLLFNFGFCLVHAGMGFQRGRRDVVENKICGGIAQLGEEEKRPIALAMYAIVQVKIRSAELAQLDADIAALAAERDGKLAALEPLRLPIESALSEAAARRVEVALAMYRSATVKYLTILDQMQHSLGQPGVFYPDTIPVHPVPPPVQQRTITEKFHYILRRSR